MIKIVRNEYFPFSFPSTLLKIRFFPYVFREGLLYFFQELMISCYIRRARIPLLWNGRSLFCDPSGCRSFLKSWM